MLLLLVQVKALRLPPLVRLRPLNGGHERVRHGRLVGPVRRRGEAVQGHSQTQLEGFELDSGRVRAVPGPGARVAQRRGGGGGETEEGGDGVERRRLGVAAAAGDGHRLV